MRETYRTRLERLERSVPIEQRLAVDAMRGAGLGRLAAGLGGAGAVAWLAALDSLFEGFAPEGVQRIAAGEDPADALEPDVLAVWELRSAKLDALERELMDPG